MIGTAVRTIFSMVLVAACALGAVRATASEVLVLEFELNDLTLYPKVEQERARVASLRPLLVEDLAAMGALELAALPAAAAEEAAKGEGYLFDRPELTARLGREAGADWVVTGRLHKASHLFVYLKAQLIEPERARVAADFVVEIKGWGEKLTAKGVESLAVQIAESIAALEASASRTGGAKEQEAAPASPSSDL